MATTAHGPSYTRYAALHPDTELAACCDLDPERAETFRTRFGFARAYTDFPQMLDAEKPDAVCLVAPEDLTCELTCRVLALGYPLLMEKPPGKSVEEIDRMIAAAQASGMPTQVAFNRRHTPLLAALKERLTTASGAIQHIRCEFTRVGRLDPDFSTTAIHGIDSLRFLAGSDYGKARFSYQALPALGDGVSNFFVDAEMDSGATAHLSFCPVSGEVVERYTVYTAESTFHLHLPIWSSLDIPGRLQQITKNKSVLDVPCEIAAKGGPMFEANGFYAENAAFFDAIRAGVPPSGDLRDARQSVEIGQCLRERRADYDKSSV
jgi:predicted dehydrogenase